MLDKLDIRRRAEKHLVSGDYARAIGYYKKIVRKQGNDDPSVLNTLGDLLLRNGEEQEAVLQFQQVAEIFIQSGFLEKAVAVCRKIHRIDPGDEETLDLLLELYEDREMNTEAAQYLGWVVERQKEKRDIQGALHLQRRLVAMDRQPEQVFSLASLHREVGETAEAVTHYLEAARLYLQQNRPEKAQASALSLLELERDHEEAREFIFDPKILASFEDPPAAEAAEVEEAGLEAASDGTDERSLTLDGEEADWEAAAEELELETFFEELDLEASSEEREADSPEELLGEGLGEESTPKAPPAEAELRQSKPETISEEPETEAWLEAVDAEFEHRLEELLEDLDPSESEEEVGKSRLEGPSIVQGEGVEEEAVSTSEDLESPKPLAMEEEESSSEKGEEKTARAPSREEDEEAAVEPPKEREEVDAPAVEQEEAVLSPESEEEAGKTRLEGPSIVEGEGVEEEAVSTTEDHESPKPLAMEEEESSSEKGEEKTARASSREEDEEGAVEPPKEREEVEALAVEQEEAVLSPELKEAAPPTDERAEGSEARAVEAPSLGEEEEVVLEAEPAEAAPYSEEEAAGAPREEREEDLPREASGEEGAARTEPEEAAQASSEQLDSVVEAEPEEDEGSGESARGRPVAKLAALRQGLGWFRRFTEENAAEPEGPKEPEDAGEAAAVEESGEPETMETSPAGEAEREEPEFGELLDELEKEQSLQEEDGPPEGVEEVEAAAETDGEAGVPVEASEDFSADDEALAQLSFDEPPFAEEPPEESGISISFRQDPSLEGAVTPDPGLHEEEAVEGKSSEEAAIEEAEIEQAAGEPVQETPPRSPRACRRAGTLYSEMGMFDEAVVKFSEAYELSLSHDNEEEAVISASSLASAYLRMADYRKAVEWADRALEFRNIPEKVAKNLQYDRSFALEMLGNLQGSLSGYRVVYRLDPGFRDVESRITHLETRT